jgi:hypothetical protein
MAALLTTTVRNLDESFVTWCTHHLRIFDRLMVWIDDPAESDSPFIPGDERIIVRLGCQERKQSVHGSMMHRQVQNANQAGEWCAKYGIEWLCHLDSDELLYPENEDAIRESWRSSAGLIAFRNHEVCCVWEAANPFRECQYFKLNGKMRFNFYKIGKSAVRCKPGIFAKGAHRFAGYEGRQVTSTKVSVLHYACPTFRLWLRKYETLGPFPSYWWDNPALPIKRFPFHLGSRDICAECRRSGDWSSAYIYYSTQVRSAEEIEKLQRKGRVRRFAPLERYADARVVSA